MLSGFTSPLWPLTLTSLSYIEPTRARTAKWSANRECWSNSAVACSTICRASMWTRISAIATTGRAMKKSRKPSNWRRTIRISVIVCRDALRLATALTYRRPVWAQVDLWSSRTSSRNSEHQTILRTKWNGNFTIYILTWKILCISERTSHLCTCITKRVSFVATRKRNLSDSLSSYVSFFLFFFFYSRSQSQY